ncbi:hypothetical protein HMPREF1861_00891 [Corynebacterium kroppenstedtii]|nr:hypothetical protein HMPREF1861_00891 [Corynebacterium kroppenstedtii]
MSRSFVEDIKGLSVVRVGHAPVDDALPGSLHKHNAQARDRYHNYERKPAKPRSGPH